MVCVPCACVVAMLVLLQRVATGVVGVWGTPGRDYVSWVRRRGTCVCAPCLPRAMESVMHGKFDVHAILVRAALCNQAQALVLPAMCA